MSDQQQRFLTLFMRHRGDLEAFVVSVVRDWNRADDIVQETSLVLWRKFAEYDPAYSFGAWARGIAVREILKDRSRQRQTRVALSPEAIAAVAQAYDTAEPGEHPRIEAMQRCLEHLDPRARTLLDLRYRDDLPLAEVATRTARSLAAVTKALLRLREALERCVRGRLDAGGTAR